MLLSNMQDDLMYKFEEYDIDQEMLLAIKEKFTGTSTTKRRLTIKFDSNKKHPNDTMR